MNQPELSIIVVSYKAPAFVTKCLESLYRFIADIRFEIIVVDNASNDGSVEKIKNDFPETKVIENTENEGYARAINKGLEYANGTFCAIMNQDTEITDNLFPSILQIFQSNSDIGAAGSAITGPEGKKQRSYFRYPTIAGRLAWFLGITRKINIESLANITGIPKDPDIIEVDVVCGAFMVLRREVLTGIRGFDPDYFLYHEEADLCFRLNREGLRNIIIQNQTIIHHGVHVETVDNPSVFYHRNRSLLLFFLKNRTKLSLLLLIKINIFVFSLKYLSALMPFGDKFQRQKLRIGYRSVLNYHWKFLGYLGQRGEKELPL